MTDVVCCLVVRSHVEYGIMLRITVYSSFGSVVWYQYRCQSRSAIQVWLWVIISLKSEIYVSIYFDTNFMFSLLPSCNRGMILVMITIWFFLVDMWFNSLKLDASLSHKIRRTNFNLQIIIVLYFVVAVWIFVVGFQL